MKTVSVALVLCLNVGVDPPDVVKTTPCARLECWIGKSRRSLRSLMLVCANPGCLAVGPPASGLLRSVRLWFVAEKVFQGELI